MVATATAVGIKTSVSIQDDEVDITKQTGGDIVKKLIGDHDDYHEYEWASLTEVIIARGRHRVSKGWGCKHIGFRYEDGELGQWCDDACIWAGGEWRIT